MGRARTSPLLALLLALPARALAYEDQVGLGIGVGYAGLPSDATLPHHGFVVQAEVGFGLSDAWELRVSGSWALHLEADAMHRATAAAEIVYLVDVLEVVPLLGLGLDVPLSVLMRGDGTTDVFVDVAAHAVLGVDWLASRDWALGVEVRPYLVPTAWTRAHGGAAWLTAVARVQLLFEIGP